MGKKEVSKKRLKDVVKKVLIPGKFKTKKSKTPVIFPLIQKSGSGSCWTVHILNLIFFSHNSNEFLKEHINRLLPVLIKDEMRKDIILEIHRYLNSNEICPEGACFTGILLFQKIMNFLKEIKLPVGLSTNKDLNYYLGRLNEKKECSKGGDTEQCAGFIIILFQIMDFTVIVNMNNIEVSYKSVKIYHIMINKNRFLSKVPIKKKLFKLEGVILGSNSNYIKINKETESDKKNLESKLQKLNKKPHIELFNKFKLLNKEEKLNLDKIKKWDIYEDNNKGHIISIIKDDKIKYHAVNLNEKYITYYPQPNINENLFLKQNVIESKIRVEFDNNLNTEDKSFRNYSFGNNDKILPSNGNIEEYQLFIKDSNFNSAKKDDKILFGRYKTQKDTKYFESRSREENIEKLLLKKIEDNPKWDNSLKFYKVTSNFFYYKPLSIRFYMLNNSFDELKKEIDELDIKDQMKIFREDYSFFSRNSNSNSKSDYSKANKSSISSLSSSLSSIKLSESEFFNGEIPESIKKFIKEQLTYMSIIKISDDYEYGSDYIDNMIRHYYNFFKESNSEYFKEEIKKMELEKDKMEVENNSVQLKEKRRRSSKSTSSLEQKRKQKIT
jgi:hypothetical protein